MQTIAETPRAGVTRGFEQLTIKIRGIYDETQSTN
jgi:hypothetical protein